MSLRPEIFGFNLSQMRSHFGSKNEAIIQHIVSRVEPVAQDIEEEDEEEAARYRANVSETARAIIMDGAPVKGLESEEDIHFDIAQALVTYEQKPVGVGSNIWKMNAFWDFQPKYGKRLGGEAESLLGHLISGRPMFGRAMKIDWSYYSYLTNAEVKTLLAALRKLQQEEPSLVGKAYLSGFVDTLIGWLEKIDSQEMDLFLYAC